MPEEVQALDTAAREAMDTGRPDEAEALLREALRLDPAAAPVRTNLAACLGMQGRLQEAEAELREVLARHPAYLFPRALLVALIAQAGREEEARREADRAVELATRETPDPAAADQLVSALGLLDHDAGLEALFVVLQPLAAHLSPESLCTLALAAHRVGRDGSAFEEALGRHPAAGYEPFASGLEALRSSRIEKLVHLQRRWLAEELRQQADRWARTGRLPEAEAHYRRVLELVPDAVGSRINLSNLYRSVGRLEEAQALLEEAAAHQDHPGVLLNLAGVLTERGELGQAEALMEQLDVAVLDEPLQVLFHLVQAEGWSRAGDHGRALAAWEEAARIDPDAEEVRRTRAEIDRRREESEVLSLLHVYQDRRRERLERAILRAEGGERPPVRELLRVLTPDNLQAVWRHYREDPPPAGRAATVDALARTAAERLPETLASLSKAERAVLEEVSQAGGAMPLEALAEHHPGFRQDSWFWDRTPPEGPVGRLRFLQVLGFGRLGAREEPVAFLPREVRACR
ncbi:tetratricopeptide repeat protein [Limnochorda pilosa]|uniref:Tetratricopeptide repeat protein n=1 Tax=Limnochorda pilosa TaxID=1555112 RepID=A0A0K2SID8_LIMPI|nr:tetratricopeptide repeat protein [Limnochorda pilosa]BAS26604.1 hypothetical protein LIP_0747 [Limnochorda pilosa]